MRVEVVAALSIYLPLRGNETPTYCIFNREGVLVNCSDTKRRGAQISVVCVGGQIFLFLP